MKLTDYTDLSVLVTCHNSDNINNFRKHSALKIVVYVDWGKT